MPSVFSDVNLDISENEPYELVHDEISIQKSILTILGTRVGTRLFRRDFGSYLMDILYDPMTEVTVSRIKIEIMRAIEQWETRVELTKQAVIPDYDNQVYFVQLEYIIPKLANKSSSFVFNLASSSQS